METHILAGVKFANTHTREACAPHACIFHAPSSHKMRDWKPNLRETGLIERLCEHGVGHPDPDSARWLERRMNHKPGTWSSHGCDGCCQKTTSIETLSNIWNGK